MLHFSLLSLLKEATTDLGALFSSYFCETISNYLFLFPILATSKFSNPGLKKLEKALNSFLRNKVSKTKAKIITKVPKKIKNILKAQPHTIEIDKVKHLDKLHHFLTKHKTKLAIPIHYNQNIIAIIIIQKETNLSLGDKTELKKIAPYITHAIQSLALWKLTKNRIDKFEKNNSP